MSFETFTPKLWVPLLLDEVKNNLVYGNLVNRDYQGMIQGAGDSVIINRLGKVTVKDYDRKVNIEAPEELGTNDIKLVIDQEKYFNFMVGDVDAVQAAGNIMSQATTGAGEQLAEVMDNHLAGVLADGAIVEGLGDDTTPLVIDSDTAYPTMVKLNMMMNKANVTRAGRWIVVPPEFEAIMLQDDRFVKAGVQASETRLVEGQVYRASGFNIYISNNVPNTDYSRFKIIASTNRAASLAEQIVEMEAFRPESRFADALKGLHVYGSKLVRPEECAVATVDFT